MMARINHARLSKVISHALRHEPWVYELELDEEGWVATPQLLSSLRSISEWSNLAVSDIEEMIATSPKKRHEVIGKRIRAVYGHSIPGKLKRTEPPGEWMLPKGEGLHARRNLS